MSPSPRIKSKIEAAMAIVIALAWLAAHSAALTSDNAHRCLNGTNNGKECVK